MKQNFDHKDQTRHQASSLLESEIEQNQRIGQYQIVAKLGKGGMGIVYKAFDSRIKRTVAIKLMLDSAFAQPTALKRFWREIQISSRLDHPHIVKVYNVATIADIPYLVLEYIEGKPLLDYFDAGCRQLPEKLKAIAKIACALDHAHRNKIIHRDIKPSNIMIRSDGQPVLLDFGLAKATEVDDHSLTKSGQVVGTPQYMAPEQAQGHRREIDNYSDVYGLGGVLYHLLTGYPPAGGETLMEVLLQVTSEKPLPPRALCPEIPATVEKICLKALEKKKKNRYASAQALAGDIEAYLGKRTPAAVWFYRRQKALTVLRMLLAGAALILVAWGIHYGYRLYASGTMRQLQLEYRRGKELAEAGHWDQAYVRFSRALSLLENRQQQTGNSYHSWNSTLVSALVQTYYRQGQQKLEQIPEEAGIYFNKARKLQRKYVGLWPKQDYLAWNHKLRFVSLLAYFRAHAYSDAYGLATKMLDSGHRPSQSDHKQILWMQARADYHSNFSRTNKFFLSLLRQSKPQEESHIGAIYYLGRIAFQANNISQAKTNFAKALALLEKYATPCTFRPELGLYFCNTLLASGEGALGRQERAAFAKYFPDGAVDLCQDNIYRETLARYHLRTAQGNAADKKTAAKKALQLLDRCLENIPNNSEYYYLRGQTNMCIGNYQAAADDLSTALYLAPHRLNIFGKKLELLSIHISPSQLPEYDKDFMKYFGEAFSVMPNMFSDEFDRERRRLLLISTEGAIPFSAAKFSLFYRRLVSGSAEVRKMATRAICSLQPPEKVAQAIAAQNVANQEQATVIKELRAQLRQAMQHRYKQKFLYLLARLPCYSRMERLPQYHNSRDIALLQKIVTDKKSSIYLRFLAARAVVHLPGLQLRKWLLDLCRAEKSSATTVLLATRALHEIGFSDFDWQSISKRCPGGR